MFGDFESEGKLTDGKSFDILTYATRGDGESKVGFIDATRRDGALTDVSFGALTGDSIFGSISSRITTGCR